MIEFTHQLGEHDRKEKTMIVECRSCFQPTTVAADKSRLALHNGRDGMVCRGSFLRPNLAKY